MAKDELIKIFDSIKCNIRTPSLTKQQKRIVTEDDCGNDQESCASRE